MRGRKPKPMHLKLIADHRSLEVAPALPDAPEFLSNDAKIEWARVVPLLSALGLLSTLDVSALAVYCQAWGTFKQATIKLELEGLTMKSINGNPMKNPMIGVLNKAAANMMRYATEFGLTPVSRTRLAIAPQAIDPSDKYFSD